MKAWIYHLLVNRVPGIRDRYLHQRQNTTARWKVLFYLLWLNVQYYLLFRRKSVSTAAEANRPSASGNPRRPLPRS